MFCKKATASGIYVGSRAAFEAMNAFITQHELHPKTIAKPRLTFTATNLNLLKAANRIELVAAWGRGPSEFA